MSIFLKSNRIESNRLEFRFQLLESNRRQEILKIDQNQLVLIYFELFYLFIIITTNMHYIYALLLSKYCVFKKLLFI